MVHKHSTGTNSRDSGAQRRPWRIILAIPVGRYAVDFASGYFNIDGWQFYSYGFFFWLGPVLAAVYVPVFVIRKSPLALCVAAGVVVFALVLSLTFFALPAPPAAFCHGFQAALRSRTDLAKLQSWAERTLEAYDRGELGVEEAPVLGPTPPLPGVGKLAERDIPDYLRQGIFDTWSGMPQVMICAGHDLEPSLAICWALHGIVVGRRDPMPRLGPGMAYIHLLRPGILVYYIER